MAQRDAFDRAIRNKVENFAPEPREEVWKNIRKEIQPRKGWSGKDWFGVALLLCSIGFFALQFSVRTEIPAGDLTAVQHAAGAFDDLADRQVKTAAHRKTEASVSETEADATEAAETSPEEKMIAAHSTKGTSPDKPAKTEKAEFTQPQKQEKPVLDGKNETISTATPVKIPIQYIGEKQEKDKIPVKEEVQPEPQEITQQGENVTFEGKQTQRSKLLDIVTDGAEKLLGIETQFEEKEDGDQKQTKFSADFKLFKIKRVKTRKK